MRREARFPVAGIRGRSAGILQAAALACVPQNLNFTVLPRGPRAPYWLGMADSHPVIPSLFFSLVAPWVEEED